MGAALLLCCAGAAAQNGVYAVANREALRAEMVERLGQSMLLNATVEDNVAEHSGMRPEGADTTELAAVLSDWLSEQLSADMVGTVPSEVRIDDERIVALNPAGDTVTALQVVERKGSNADRQEWVFVCADGRRARLGKQDGREWRLRMPDGMVLVLHKGE